jgi:hypothetical protein
MARWVTTVAHGLTAIEGVVGVALGGSRARGTNRPGSDVDLALYYRGGLSRRAVLKVIELVHDRGAELTVTEPGEWGPWIDGGAWFQVAGLKADLLYRNVDRVRRVIDDATNGQFTSAYQPGHPAGFHSYHLMAEVGVNVPITDPKGLLLALQDLTSPYPRRLRAAIIRRFLWEANFQLEILERTEVGTDPFFEHAALSRVLACLVQVLYSGNERWFLNEKRAVDELKTFRVLPDHFQSRLVAVTRGGAAGTREARALHVDIARAFGSPVTAPS